MCEFAVARWWVWIWVIDISDLSWYGNVKKHVGFSVHIFSGMLKRCLCMIFDYVHCIICNFVIWLKGWSME